MRYLALSSIRTRFVALVLLAFIPMLAWDVYSASEQRRLAAQAVQEHTFRLLQPISAYYDQVMVGAREVISVLAESPSVLSRDSVAASARFAGITKRHPIYADIGAVKPNGQVFASSNPGKTPANVADEPWFKLALKTREFSIGRYQIDRRTKKATVYVMFSHPNSAGKVGTVMYAAIELSSLTQLASRMRLPQQSSLLFLDSDGTILLRYPNPEQWVGKSLSGTKLRKAILGQQMGLVEAAEADGIVRTYAFTLLGDETAAQKIYLAIGVPSEIVYAQANAMLMRSLLLLGLVVLVSAVTMWIGSNSLILRKVEALGEAANRLAQGDLDARTGLVYSSDELGRLAECFDKMADSIKALTHLKESILNSAGEGICGMDVQGNVTFLNAAGAAALGRSAEECIGQPLDALVHPNGHYGMPGSEEERMYRLTIGHGTWGRATDASFRREDGTLFPVDYVAAPMRENSELTGAVVVFRDITERKQMEEALRKSEYFLRQVLDATPHITFVIDESLQILLGNTALADFYDAPLDEIVGTTQPELHKKLGMPVIELQEWIADNRRALEEGPIEFFEYSHSRAGVGAWYRTKKLPLVLADGRKAVLVISEDISELKETEEHLRKTNRMLRVLSAINQVLVRATEESELLQSTCKTIVQVGGYRMVWIGFAEHDEEKTVRPVCSAGHVEGYLDVTKATWSDTELGRTPVGLAIRTGQPAYSADILTDECFVPWREEAVKRGYASCFSVPLMSRGEAFGAIVLYGDEPGVLEPEESLLLMELANDLSYGVMMARTGRALREREEQYRTIVETAREGIWSIDSHFKTVYVNQRMAEMLGYTVEEMLGRSYRDFVAEEDWAEWVRHMERPVRDAAEVYDIRFLLKDGSVLWAMGSTSQILDEQGRIAGAFSMFTDVTERRTLEEHKRDFYRRTIQAATEGKLIICEKNEIEKAVGLPIWSRNALDFKDLSLIRHTVSGIARSAGMDEIRVCDFILCVGEAATNAIKHAGGGMVSVHRLPESLVFVVSDQGPGIAAINLPEVALKRGYTTAASLGMGYKAIISIADQVYLATGPTGTTVGIEMKLHIAERPLVVLSQLPDAW